MFYDLPGLLGIIYQTTKCQQEGVEKIFVVHRMADIASTQFNFLLM